MLNLAQANLYRGKLEEAAPPLEEALRVSSDIGYREALVYALEGFAAIGAARGEPARSARLLGAAETMLLAIGASLDRAATDRHERTLEALRAQLDDGELAECLSEGCCLSAQEASEEALALV